MGVIDDSEDLDDLRFGKMVRRIMRLPVIQALLAGNDTCCFTTGQYKAEYERQMIEMHKSKGLPPWKPFAFWDLDVADRHLRSMPDVVREVNPGVWTGV